MHHQLPLPSPKITFSTSWARKRRNMKTWEKLDILLKETERLVKIMVFIIASDKV